MKGVTLKTLKRRIPANSIISIFELPASYINQEVTVTITLDDDAAEMPKKKKAKDIAKSLRGCVSGSDTLTLDEIRSERLQKQL